MESTNAVNGENTPSESLSTRLLYNLNFSGFPNISQLVAIALATAVYTVLTYVTLAIFASFQGVSTLFIPLAIGLAFCLWFGGWGLLIVYIGNAVGGNLLFSAPLIPSLIGGFSDVIQLGIPMILYRLLAPRFGVDAIGKDALKLKGFLFLVVMSLFNIPGGLYGTWTLVSSGIVPAEAFLLSWGIWASTNIIILLVTGPFLLGTLSPIVERFGLSVRTLLR